MTFATGDPAHINLGHNELLALIQEQADRFMVTVTLPDVAGLGDTGHVDDHNLIVAALQDIADADAGLAPATVSGTTGSPATSTVSGRTLYEWNGNGTITFATDGWVRVLNVSGGKAGGGGSTTNAGGGGLVQDVWLYVTAGTYTVTVGAGGTYPYGSGGISSLVKVNAIPVRGTAMATTNVGNGAENNTAVGILSDIDGTPEGFGGSGYSTTNAGTYDSQYGGAQSAAVARANSGGGGNEVGSGNGAAGCVKVLV